MDVSVQPCRDGMKVIRVIVHWYGIVEGLTMSG